MGDQEQEARLGDEVATGDARVKAGELLASAQVGFLAVTDGDGPYCVPVSFAYDGEDIYFHGGEGKKSKALQADPRACLAVMSGADLVKGATACDDNFKSRTTLVFGAVTRLESAFEKDAALRTIIAKYHPEEVASPLGSARVERTTVYRMKLRAVTYRELPGD